MVAADKISRTTVVRDAAVGMRLFRGMRYGMTVPPFLSLQLVEKKLCEEIVERESK